MEDETRDEEIDEGLTEETVPTGEAAYDELRDINDRYLRLYADFDNYRKNVAKQKEEIARYANEELLIEILPSLDHLEIALKHSRGENSGGIVEGVENTLRELYRSLEKFGLKKIEAVGKPFDPGYHHAMSQVDRDDVKDKTVVEEFRKGYVFKDRVLRASLVSVSRKNFPAGDAGEEEPDEGIELDYNEKEDS